MSDDSEDVGLEVGETIPDVTASLVIDSDTTTTTSLHELLDDKPTLFIFYTNDFSPDCVKEWCSFRDYEWFASNSEINVVGVNNAKARYHKHFKNIFDITYPLFADTDFEITDAFDVRYKAFGVATRPYRSCFFVDQDYTVQYKWLSEHPLDPTRDIPEMEELHEEIESILDN